MMNTMNSKIRWNMVIIILCIVFAHCTRYDDYKKYMPDGVIIYPQKVDNLRTYPGRNRIQLEWLIVDPKVTSCKVFYMQGGIQDSTTVLLKDYDDYVNGVVRIIIPDLEETSYEFKIISYDASGRSSIIVEKEEKAYGKVYESTLFNRAMRNVEYSEDEGLQIDWYAAAATEIGMILEYTDILGEVQTLEVARSEISTPIPDFKLSEPLYCRTMHKPVSAAIDTFWAQRQKVSIEFTESKENVTLNKPATASSDYGSGGYTADKAVDGDYSSTASRWLTPSDVFTEHWLEVDLQLTAEIYSFRLVRHYTATYSHQQTPRWEFQAWVNEAWVTIISEDNCPSGAYPDYYKEFEPVRTNKVRWYLPAYENNMVRLYEMEVWGIVRRLK